MKNTKLDMRGFSHDVVILMFVVVFAVIGVGYIVLTHAQDCGTPASGATSSVASSPTSTSCAPASSVAVLSGNCVITNLPTKLKYNSIYHPSVAYTNTGNTAFTPSGAAGTSFINENHKNIGGHGGGASAPSLSPGTSETVSTGIVYTATRASAQHEIVVFQVWNNNPSFTCSQQFRLPT